MKFCLIIVFAVLIPASLVMESCVSTPSTGKDSPHLMTKEEVIAVVRAKVIKEGWREDQIGEIYAEFQTEIPERAGWDVEVNAFPLSTGGHCRYFVAPDGKILRKSEGR